MIESSRSATTNLPRRRRDSNSKITDDEKNYNYSPPRRWFVFFILTILIAIQFQVSRYKISAVTSVATQQLLFAGDNGDAVVSHRNGITTTNNNTLTYFGNRTSSIADVNTSSTAKHFVSEHEASHGDGTKTPKQEVLDELELLTKSHNPTKDCPSPLLYYENRIVQNTPSNNQKTIPKILHVSFRSRCLPQDVYMYLKRWEEQLPETSIFFHDDNAVQDLIHDPDFSIDFPWLESAMKCVLSKGAMTIDVWRIMVLFKYGGIYTDIDNWPEDIFGEATIPSNVSGFFYSDDWKRPSQWFMAFEPNHPILYLALEEIIQNLFHLEKIQHPKVVFVTGPHAVRQAYVKFMTHANATLEEYRNNSRRNNEKLGGKLSVDIFKSPNYYRGMSGKIVRKEPYPKGILKPKKYYSDMVPYNGTMIKRKERIVKESGVRYWKQKGLYGTNKDKKQCKEAQRKWRTWKTMGQNQTTTATTGVVTKSKRTKKKKKKKKKPSQ